MHFWRKIGNGIEGCAKYCKYLAIYCTGIKINGRTKLKIARILGVDVSELFDQYYRVVNKDLGTRGDFSHKLGVMATDPNWKFNPGIDCGAGLHLVWGHPLLAVKYTTRSDPRYFRLPAGTTSSLVPSADSDGKLRAKSIMLLEENELGAEAPEFDQELLKKIFRNSRSTSIRKAAFALINDQGLIAECLQGTHGYELKAAAIPLTVDQELLKRISESEPTTRSWQPGSLALKRLNELKASQTE